MADNHAHPVSHPALDDAEQKTCPLFLQLTKYTVASAGLILALLALYYG
jgi:hypothetical protein